MKKLFCSMSALWVFAGGLCAAPADTYTLVKDGKPASVIVVPRQRASEVAAWGAKEIQDHIRKITGAEVPIVTDEEKVADGLVKISVGDTALSRAAGLDMGKLAEQEYQLQFEPGLILLMGRDRYPNPWPLDVQGRYQSAAGVFGKGFGAGQIVWTSHAFPDGKGSIEVWVRNDVRGNIWKIGGQEGDSPDQRHTLYMDEKRDYALGYLTVADGRREKLEGPKLTPGWHLVTTTWDEETRKKQILVDGKVVAEGPYEKTQCGSAKIFAIPDRSADGAGGPIDEFRMSRKIVRTYPRGVEKKPFEKDEHTKLLLHFDEADGVIYDGEKPWAESPAAKVPGYGMEVGTTYAVYDFLEKYCGVRWYFPGDWGTVCPTTSTLTVRGVKNVKRRPAILYRSSTGYGGGGNGEFGTLMNCILRNHAVGEDVDKHHARIRMSVWAPLNVSHSFYGYYDRFWAKNPSNPAVFEVEHKDWFSRRPDGSPIGNPPDQMCYTSTGFIAQVIAEAKQAYARGARVFGVVPMDNMGQCQCKDCAPLQVPLDQRNKSYSFMNNYASELIWGFVAKVAHGVAKDCPGLLIGQLSYADYSAAPKTVKLPANVCAGPCWAPNLYYTLAAEQPVSEQAQYYEWVSMKKKTGMLLNCWVYQCFPNEYGGMQGYKNWPGFHAHRLEKYLRLMANDKIDSIFLCGTASHIDGYLTARLMDDPTINVDDVLNEFFPQFYGKAGVPMRKLYDAIEQSYLDQGGGSLTESYDRYRIREILRDGSRWMKEAGTLAVTDDEKKRVALFEEAVWKHILEGWDQYVTKWGGKPPYPFCYKGGAKPVDRMGGKFGNAIKLGQAITVWDHGFSDKAGTVEMWVMAAAATNGEMTGGNIFQINSQPLLSPGPYTGHSITRESYTGADGQKRCDQYVYETWIGGRTNRVVSGPVGDGWHHLMARWDAKGGKMDLVIDGKVKKSGPYKATTCATARRIAIGGVADAPSGSGFSFGDWGWSRGPLDEFRLSSVVRPAALQKAPHEGDKNTLLLLHFDEEQGQYPTDSSGRNRDLQTKSGDKHKESK